MTPSAEVPAEALTVESADALPYGPPPPAASAPLAFEPDPVADAPLALPDGPLTTLQMAMLELGEGRVDAARDRLQTHLASDDGDYRAMFFLAWSLRLLGDKFLAQQFFTIGAKVAQDAGDEAFQIMYRAELG